MKIVIVGGTGMIGKRMQPLLEARGHTVVSASPSTGVNLLTGEGVAEAFRGAEAVVDVTNPADFSQAVTFFTQMAEKTAAAELAAGVAHHVALSVVGADAMDSTYMRGKQAQERIIAAAGVPYTIVRATQFYEFLAVIGDVSTVDGVVHLPPVKQQPMAADEVAAMLSAITLEAAANGIVELAGPEVKPLPEFVELALRARGDQRPVVVDAAATYFGAHVTENTLVPALGSPLISQTTFAQWRNLAQ